MQGQYLFPVKAIQIDKIFVFLYLKYKIGENNK